MAQLPSLEEIKHRLTSEGYVNVYDWYDSPEFEYHEHSHPSETIVYVLQGSMDVGLPDGHALLAPGSSQIIPANVEHTTLVGAEGCQYVLGEKPNV